MGKLIKKIIASTGAIFGVLALTLSVSLGAHAATPAVTEITGVVTANGSSVADASVTVKCGGHVAYDTTDAAGSYRVSFFTGDCPFGTTAKVLASKGSMGGTASGTVMGLTTKLNLAVINVSIPEYGLIGAAIAAGAGAGLIGFTRRRQKMQEL